MELKDSVSVISIPNRYNKFGQDENEKWNYTEDGKFPKADCTPFCYVIRTKDCEESFIFTTCEWYNERFQTDKLDSDLENMKVVAWQVM